MKNSFMLTPYFLDDSMPGLTGIVGDTWLVNQPTLPGGKRQERMAALYQPLKIWVTKTVGQGNRPVSWAGDCCASIGVLAGLQHSGLNPTLLWFDAHGDFNTWETTPSGFLGGMPLAMLVGRGEQTMVDGVGLQPINENRIILTDARDLDLDEKVALKNSDIDHRKDINTLLRDPLPKRPIYLHFDTDVIDPAEAPAMNYPADGGPSVRAMSKIFKRLSQSGQIVAVSVSAWNPELDKNSVTRTAVTGLVKILIS